MHNIGMPESHESLGTAVQGGVKPIGFEPTRTRFPLTTRLAKFTR